MAKVNVAAFAASGKSGVTLALSEAKAGQFFRLGLTEAAQVEFFGGPLNTETDALEILLDDEPGKVHVMGLQLAAIGDPSALPLGGGIKGAVALKLSPWCQVAPGKRPAASLAVLTRQPGKLVTLRLPDWARLAPRKVGQGRPIME